MGSVNEPHSVSTEIAADRPDESDTAKVNKFCRDLGRKVKNANRKGEITVPGYKAYNGLPLKPKGGLKCTNAVFALSTVNRDECEFKIQKEELESVLWRDFCKNI